MSFFAVAVLRNHENRFRTRRQSANEDSMTDKPTKPKPPLTPAKLAGKVAEYTVLRDQAVKDALAHIDTATGNDFTSTPAASTLADLVKVCVAIDHSVNQAKHWQKKLDALGAK